MPTIAAAHEGLIQFLHQAPIGLIETSIDGEIRSINPTAAQLLRPLSRDGKLHNLFTMLERAAPQLREIATAFKPPTGVVCDAFRIALDCATLGTSMSQVLAVSVFKLAHSRMLVILNDVTVQAISELRGAAGRLDATAGTDSLTGMPDRAAALALVRQSLARAASDPGYEFAVLFINCDRFRRINDTLGHAAGDTVLGLIAERLRSTLRSQSRAGRKAGADQMAARVGGDEFVVVLDGLRRADDVHSVAQRLIDMMSKPYGVGPNQVHCSISMGVVLPAQAAAQADTVLQDASIAMVEAKRAGGARYVIFEPAMQERAARRGGTEAELRRALTAGQLFVMYQPVVDLQNPDKSRGCTAVEALVRWRHPTRGLVMPREFIGVAEECGLIGAIGDFVLSTACRQFVKWQRTLGACAPRMLAVNLSRAQLGQPGFVASVGDILSSTGMPPELLQLEVTESLAAQDEAVQARLHELKALRLTLALDDFGTGYSSLASLHQLPVDTVKIDRSFVSQADTSRHHRVLIEATVRVASSLGMSTVAEGIETAAQAAMVRRLGCEKGQGYYFARPLSSADLVRWLTQSQSEDLEMPAQRAM